MTEPRVVIVDDHKLFRSGVRAELEPLLEILAEAGTVEEAEAAIARHEPDVVLLDVHMPGGGGVEVIRRAAAAGQRPTFLALSVSDAAEDVIAVIRARPPWRSIRPTIDSRTPRRSSGTAAGSKPGPRSRTNTWSV